MARPRDISIPKALLSSPAAISGCSAEATGRAPNEAALTLVALIARHAARETIDAMDASEDSTASGRESG